MTQTNQTATAHEAWDEAWKSEQGRADWLKPDPDVVEGVAFALERPGRRALDLGCGVGRHALALCAAGFEVTAIDAAVSGVDHLKREADHAGYSVDARVGPMTKLPFEDDAFDFVLSFNVIYHGDGAIVRQTIAEIERVLTPGGLYQGTMMPKENAHFGKGEEIAPNTFIDAGDGDKAHPHFYCDEPELRDLFGNFQILDLKQRQHRTPGSWHWHMLAQHQDPGTCSPIRP